MTIFNDLVKVIENEYVKKFRDRSMVQIIETVVTTSDGVGNAHIAPLGLIAQGVDRWIIAPFKPSRTLDNLRAVPFAVANHTDDVRIYAGSLTGRRQWPSRKAHKIDGCVLDSALSHWELAVEEILEDELRPHFICRLAHKENHAPWTGFNRAQGAVIECAVLVSRLHMLPAEKIEAELKYLTIAVEKTAGPREEEAWGWLMERVEEWREKSKQAD